MSCLVLAPLGSILPWKPNCAVNPVRVYFIQQISAHSALGLAGFTLSFLAPGASYTLLNVTLSFSSLLSASLLALSGAQGVTLCLYVPSVKSSFKSSIFIFIAQSYISSLSLRKLSSLSWILLKLMLHQTAWNIVKPKSKSESPVPTGPKSWP